MATGQPATAGHVVRACAPPSSLGAGWESSWDQNAQERQCLPRRQRLLHLLRHLGSSALDASPRADPWAGVQVVPERTGRSAHWTPPRA